MPVVILSPHFDDAVGSLGGAAQRLLSAGERVTIVTLTGGLPNDEADRQMVLRRRGEDQRACAILGCDNMHLPLLDAPFRHDAAGHALYRNVFSPRSADDSIVSDAISLLSAMALAPPDALYVPLAASGHVDHVACRDLGRAMEASGWRVRYYREFFYHKNSTPATGEYALRSRLELTAAEVATKIAAFSAYVSQLAGLYGSQQALVKEFEHYECEEEVYVDCAAVTISAPGESRPADDEFRR